ncbi:hypothetical protein DFJ73DRAFT_938353, partial [Zopfochytrium polystomum]
MAAPSRPLLLMAFQRRRGCRHPRPRTRLLVSLQFTAGTPETVAPALLLVTPGPLSNLPCRNYHRRGSHGSTMPCRPPTAPTRSRRIHAPPRRSGHRSHPRCPTSTPLSRSRHRRHLRHFRQTLRHHCQLPSQPSSIAIDAETANAARAGDAERSDGRGLCVPLFADQVETGWWFDEHTGR